MILNIFQLLGIVGLLLCLYEFIAMRHRYICTESDARMFMEYELMLCMTSFSGECVEIGASERLYWNRGTK